MDLSIISQINTKVYNNFTFNVVFSSLFTDISFQRRFIPRWLGPQIDDDVDYLNECWQLQISNSNNSLVYFHVSCSEENINCFIKELKINNNLKQEDKGKVISLSGDNATVPIRTRFHQNVSRYFTWFHNISFVVK